MPQDSLGDVARPTVVQEVGVPADNLGQADAPQRSRAPFLPVGLAFGPVVGKSLAHVVQQHVGVGPDELIAQFGFRAVGGGAEFGVVAAHTTDVIEYLLAAQHLWVVDIAPAGTARWRL